MFEEMTFEIVVSQTDMVRQFHCVCNFNEMLCITYITRDVVSNKKMHSNQSLEINMCSLTKPKDQKILLVDQFKFYFILFIFSFEKCH